MTQIQDITPIKYGMTKLEVQVALKGFLSKTLSPTKMLLQENIVSGETKAAIAKQYTVLTLKDGTTWVQGDKGLERIAGASYLSQKLPSLSLQKKWEVAETKYFLKKPDQKYLKCKIAKLNDLLVVECSDVIPCSKYVGDQKPAWSFFNDPLLKDKGEIIAKAGFTDLTMNANLRVQEEGSITIIDTEYGSFNTKTGDAIPPESELIGLEFEFPLREILGQEWAGSSSAEAE